MWTPPRVGIIGAGQLARMTYQAGISLGLTVRVLANGPHESAARICADVAIGSPTSLPALRAFARDCDVVTFDHELVDPAQVAALEAEGRPVYPPAATVALAQNKRRQREDLAALGFPTPPYRFVSRLEDVQAFAVDHGWPVVLKAARGGYDGRGVWVVRDAGEAAGVYETATHRGLELLVETWVPLERELAVLVARGGDGQVVTYPLVETVQVDGICHEVVAPAPVPPQIASQAQALGRDIAGATGVVGIMAVELFLAHGALLVNELATRPHNSGHYSIEGCQTSQFENHLRAILGWPLGQTALVAPAVVMANVIGASSTDPRAHLPAALEVPGVRVHLYDKRPRPGRKLGHVTAIGQDVAETRVRAQRAARCLAMG